MSRLEILESKIDGHLEDYTPVVYEHNYEDNIGYMFENRCHNKPGDKCKCNISTVKYTDENGNEKIREHCRWCNYRNLNLKDNPPEFKQYLCLCGEPITYVYQIKNIHTGKLYPENRKESGIGSDCIHQFMSEETNKQFKIDQLLVEVNKGIKCKVCEKKLKDGICKTCQKNIINQKCNCIIDSCQNKRYLDKLCRKHYNDKIKKKIDYLREEIHSKRYLKCPWNEKDTCKRLGAKWDNEKRQWYIPPGIFHIDFVKWLD